jgi:tetratricopeptide (TPR) repeat protein
LYEAMLRAVLHPGLGTQQRAVLYSRLQIAAAKQGRFEAARRYAALALDNVRASGDAMLEHVVQINLGAMEAEEGRLAAARAIFEAELARSKAAAISEPRHLASLRMNLGNLLCVQGELAAARPHLEQAVALARQDTRPQLLFNALLSLAELEDECRCHAAARAALDELLALTIVPQQPKRLAEARLLLAALDAEAGRLDVALAGMRAALAQLRGYAHVAQPPQLLAARVCRLAGRLDEARELVLEGLAAGDAGADELPLLLLEQARVELAAGRASLARQLAARARRLLRGRGMAPRAALPL